jgi:aspartate-semialdehyde dehydrogenase
LAKHEHHRASIALIGGDTLLGREIREMLESANFQPQVSLFSTDDPENVSILAKERGGPAIMAPLASAGLSSSGLLVLAGSAESAGKALEMAKQADPRPIILDLTGALEDEPSARLRAPMLEAPDHAASAPIQVIAHPAAIALALLLKRLHEAARVRRSVVAAFEPASERGQAGIDELQQQTVGLLSFKKLSKDVFDAQAAFNLLAQYGEEAPVTLGDVELKIDRHLASLLSTAGGVPMPSLRLVQAPVFHGYSFSVWVEFEEIAKSEALIAALASPQIEVRAAGVESPSNVGAAGQSGITVGAISPDRNHPRACWFWMVADNLRLVAENALEVARDALA